METITKQFTRLWMAVRTKRENSFHYTPWRSNETEVYITLEATDEMYFLGKYLAELLDELRQEAIDRHHAQYNPKTGKWEWLEEVHG